MHAIDLLQWWNLIFDLPFLAALIPLLLQASGAAHFGHGGHGIHAGTGAAAGHHVHLPHLHVPHAPHLHAGSATAAAPAPAHATAVSHAQPAHHAQSSAPSAGPIARALSLLGIGKVPIMLVFSSFCFVWGFSGLAANLILAGSFAEPSLYILPSMGIALVSSLLLTSVLSQGISKAMPSLETYTTPREGFIGKTGRALYEINAKSGAAVVLDNESNRVQIKCRTEADGAAIPRGGSLSVVRYEEQNDLFVVQESSLTDREQAELLQFEKKFRKLDEPGKNRQDN